MLARTRTHLKKLATIKRQHISKAAKTAWWFSLGALLGLFFFASFAYIVYKQSHADLIYAGVMVNGVDFGSKTREEVRTYFERKNARIQQTTFILQGPDSTATISAKQLKLGYDSTVLADQAYSLGRSNNILSNMSLLLQAYLDGINLEPTYHFDKITFAKLTDPLAKKYHINPVNAVFTMDKGKVTKFTFSQDGKAVDRAELEQKIYDSMLAVALADKPQQVTIHLPIKTVRPAITTEESNDLGIREVIAEGTSLFLHSIENRIYNISLAASRLNGVLIPPGETFSTTKTIGDISALTGYKQAYVIENGKTVLGDGGGVCQVSTTLFRAVINAGLPITERHPHAYRVGYYEQDSGPGVDAAIYYPSVDLKFKNDTKQHILIQTIPDLANYRLTFRLYGTKDNREVIVNKPVIVSQSPAPEPLYQDDPALPKGQVKQVDFAAAGAKVYFSRVVKKDGKVVSEDTFHSNYRPWQAIFLRGTKE